MHSIYRKSGFMSSTDKNESCKYTNIIVSIRLFYFHFNMTININFDDNNKQTVQYLDKLNYIRLYAQIIISL